MEEANYSQMEHGLALVWWETGLNSVSSKCARGKSSITRKPEDHPKIFSGKTLLKK